MLPNYKFALIMVMVVVSFIGFCVENVWVAITQGVINSRNMILPFLFGYGIAILLIYLLFGTPSAPLLFGKKLEIESNTKRTLYYFVISFLCVCIGEIALGYATELTCDIIWWDYSKIPLHITRYTSLPTSMAFATLITIFMKYFFNPLLSKFSNMNETTIKILAISFLVVLTLDLIYSGILMYKNHDLTQHWQIDLKKSLKMLKFAR